MGFAERNSVQKSNQLPTFAASKSQGYISSFSNLPDISIRNPKSAIRNQATHITSYNDPHMPYLFTSESVSEGHPDKVADQISDALVDNFLAWDPQSKIACETLVTTGQVVLAGEVKCNTYIDVQTIAREVIAKIGYTKSEYMFEAHSCGVLSAI